MSDSPRSILARLEQLKQWQEEQQRVLLQKQIAQRELLNQEQQKMYAILGINQTADQETSRMEDEIDSDVQEYEETNMQRQLALEHRTILHSDESDNEVQAERQEVKRKVPARPFLKRGEGLKARFKVDPNVFKLNNLPKYKYANHAKYRAQKVNQKRPDASQPKVTETKGPSEIKKKPKEQEIPPEISLDINKVYDKKLVPLAPSIPLSGSTSDESEDTDAAGGEESLLPSIEVMERIRTTIEQQKSDPPKSPIHQNLAWKHQLQDEAAILCQLKELKDLNLFELLEQRLASGNASLASDASTLLRLLAENSINISDLLLSDSTLIPSAPSQEPTEPLVPPDEVSCLEIRPVPDPKRHFLKDHETTSDSEDTDSSEDQESEMHVRFAEQVEQTSSETDLESQLETVNLSRMSTPKEKQDRRSTEREDTLTEQPDDEQHRIREEILAKSELLKTRLSELETEIESFRKENSELMRMKQEHELEKIKLEQEREEMMEKMNDERIKMEVYFHDERMKIEEQRQKTLKEAMKPTKKEKEEILRLKEQIAELQKETKAKEAKHASSLARFRSQIRNLEKDLKETQLELDVMKKDNKKLETENARLKRQNNNRMLLEINKNIAKLAAPQGEATSESRRNSSPEKPRKTVVPAKLKPIEVIERNIAGKVAKAKVISHPREDSNARKVKITVTSSESDSESEQNHSDVTSDGESNSETLEGSKSSYFRGRAKKNLFQNNDNHPEQTKEPTAQTTKSPETAELINNLKREIVNEDGSRDVWYPNGNLKKISPDGLVIRMLYFNKDIKETNMNEGTTKYYYFETNTWHTTYLDGLEILEFPDGQTEHRFKDGSSEVHFPNGSIRTTNPNSVDIAEEWKYANGSTVIVKKNDDKVITLPNGQVEIHTKAHKRRIYPDGTIKFLYPDGSQESRYSNGRVRLKDKDGNLISDTGGTV